MVKGGRDSAWLDFSFGGYYDHAMQPLDKHEYWEAKQRRDYAWRVMP